MTPELAAERAAEVLDEARKSGIDERVAALVQVADGWTRLHTALANAKWATLDTTEQPLTVNIEGMTVKEDADIAKLGDQFAREWARAHGAWWPEPKPAPAALTLPYDEHRLPTVTVYGTRYEVNAWDFESGGDAYDAILHLRKLD